MQHSESPWWHTRPYPVLHKAKPRCKLRNRPDICGYCTTNSSHKSVFSPNGQKDSVTAVNIRPTTAYRGNIPGPFCPDSDSYQEWLYNNMLMYSKGYKYIYNELFNESVTTATVFICFLCLFFFKCCAVQFSALQCSAVQGGVIQGKIGECVALQCSAVQCSIVQFSIVKCSSV